MLAQKRKSFELPPTAGLPISLSDYLKTPPQNLASALQSSLALPHEPIFTCSGTAALIIALKTLHKLHKDKTDVIMPAYTCPLVPLAVQYAGLRAVLCDTLPQSFELSHQKLAELCTNKTLAIVPTHLGGQVANVTSVNEIAKAHGAFVIEDSAQALGAFHGEESVGLVGDAGFFSLAVGKGLTTFEGGILITQNELLHKQMKSIARKLLKNNFFWTLRRNIELLGYTFMYNPRRLWRAYGKKLARNLAVGNELEATGDYFTLKDIPLHSLDALRLRVAANAFTRLPTYLDEGRRRAERYKIICEGYGKRNGEEHNLHVVTGAKGNQSVWPFLMVLMPNQKQRDAALKNLWTSGLGVSKLFIHTLGSYNYLAKSIAQTSPCPNAEDFSSRLLTISNTHWLTDDIFTHIIKTISRAP